VRHSTLAIVAGFSLLVIGCAHTNKLAQYDLHSQQIEMISGTNTAGSASASIASGSRNPVQDIIAGISSGSISNETARKLRHAANSDSLAAQIARGFEGALISYLGVVPFHGYNPKAPYRTETILQDYSLTSDSTGTRAHISALSRIIQRASSTVVWQYTSSKDIALTTTSARRNSERAVMSAVNAAMLAEMSEEEIASIFYGAAQEIGRDIGETLREDVAKLSNH
jgi:hypothetical protein